MGSTLLTSPEKAFIRVSPVNTFKKIKETNFAIDRKL